MTPAEVLKFRDQMRADRAKGMDYEEIAAFHDVARSTAHRHCKDVEVPAHLLPKRGKPRKVEPEKVAALRRKGVSVSALAKRYSVTPMCIYQATWRAAA